jgi:hypothetical protein
MTPRWFAWMSESREMGWINKSMSWVATARVNGRKRNYNHVATCGSHPKGQKGHFFVLTIDKRVHASNVRPRPRSTSGTSSTSCSTLSLPLKSLIAHHVRRSHTHYCRQTGSPRGY